MNRMRARAWVVTTGLLSAVAVLVASCQSPYGGGGGGSYDRAAVEHQGEFAHLNFPDEWPPERRAQVSADRSEEGRS